MVFHCIFLGKKGDHYYIQTRHKDLFSLYNLILRKLRALLPATIFCRFFRDLVTATFSEVTFEGPLLLEFYGTIP